MSRYCSQADLAGQVMPSVLVPLADDDRDGVADEAVLLAAIDSASDLVDGYCGPRYPVPFSPVPPIVRRLTTDLAIWNLFGRKGFDEATAEKAVVERYKAAMRFLEKVAEGKVSIGTGTETPHEPPLKVAVHSRDQVFTDELLEKF